MVVRIIEAKTKIVDNNWNVLPPEVAVKVLVYLARRGEMELATIDWVDVPVEITRGDNEINISDSSDTQSHYGQEKSGQGHEGIHHRETEIIGRPKSDEPKTGDSDSAVGSGVGETKKVDQKENEKDTQEDDQQVER
jgi:hypothetical protein